MSGNKIAKLVWDDVAINTHWTVTYPVFSNCILQQFTSTVERAVLRSVRDAAGRPIEDVWETIASAVEESIYANH